MKTRVLLEARDICSKVGEKTLVEKINLTLAAGEFLAVLGRNGAGKSSLLKVLTGERVPSSGSIQFLGQDLHTQSPKELARHRAVLAQQTHLPFDFEVLDVVAMGRGPHQKDNLVRTTDLDLARECLHTVGLQGFEERPYLQLSGGEQQRVQFARCLAQIWTTSDEAGVFFLDEPTASLDIYHQHHILDALADFGRRKRFGIFAILHDINLAARYADRILILDEGRSAAWGTSDEVLCEETLVSAFRHPVIVTDHPCRPHKLIISR